MIRLNLITLGTKDIVKAHDFFKGSVFKHPELDQKKVQISVSALSINDFKTSTKEIKSCLIEIYGFYVDTLLL